MKRLKLLLSILLSILIALSSCSDGEIDNPIRNRFTFNNQSFEIGYVSSSTFLNGIHLTLANENYLTGNYTGKQNSISIFIDETQSLTSGTYTFKLNTEQDYDSSKHFYNAEGIIMLEVVEGNATLINGVNAFQNINDGNITIEQSTTNESTYTVEFSLNFDSGIFEGNYQGIIQEN